VWVENFYRVGRTWTTNARRIAAAAQRRNSLGGLAIVSGELSVNNDVRRYPILDALRFVFAFWVVMDHYGEFPLFANADTSVPAVWLLSHSYATIVCGASAVMGFFVISGFCIHLPFRNGKTLPIARFYARRYVRILIPVVAVIAIYRFSGNRQPLFGAKSIMWSSVLWSLMCEEIYYAVYPVARWCLRRWGWFPVLSGALMLAAFTALRHFHRELWTDFGAIQTAVILYPVWLLGCFLAEKSERLAPLNSTREIWMWRCLAIGAAWSCEMLSFHAGVPYTQTMLWFGILAFFWLRKELAYGLNKQPAATLVSAGAWSYSLYLMHVPAMRIYAKLPVPNFGAELNWCLAIGFILVSAYVFYLVVERPSHRLAQRLGTSKSPAPLRVPQRVPEPDSFTPRSKSPRAISI
jgi:peptidoglycan/LPS O-acetylase OafA/YrhL